YVDHDSLSDTETRENLAQQVVAAELPGDGAQLLVRQAQFFGKQIQHLIVQLGVRTRNRQVLAGCFQRAHMPLAREPRRLGTGRPARDIQQALPQHIQPLARLRGNVQWRRRGCRYRRYRGQTTIYGRQMTTLLVEIVVWPHFLGGVQQVEFVEYLEDRRACGQAPRDLGFEFVVGVAGVLQMNDDIGAFDLRPGASDADAFDLVLGFPQTSRIYNV